VFDHRLLSDNLHAGWDAHCPGLAATLVREAKWKAKEQSNCERWATAPTSSNTGGWDVPEDDPHHKEWEESNNKLVVDSPLVSQGWPSVEGGVEVLIEVCSDLKESEEECPTYRLPVFTDCFSVIDLLSHLCHSTISTSGGSCATSCPS
jgi:hypothetical protein